MWDALDRSGMTKRMSRWPGIQVRSLGTVDHDLRPLWIQNLVLDIVESELRALIAGSTRDHSARAGRRAVTDRSRHRLIEIPPDRTGAG